MSNYRGRFVWYELMTEDAPAAKAFYEKVIGWGSQDMPMPGMADMTYTLMKAGDVQVAGLMSLPPQAKAAGARPGWIGHVAVDDVDASAKQAQTLGGKVFREPSDIPGIGRFAVIGDPQGAVIFMFKGADGPTPPMLAEGTTGAIGWRELMAGDMPKVFGFYAEMFGWTQASEFDMGPMGMYRLFAAGGGDPIGGMMTKPESTPMPHWSYYFNVDATGAAIERLKAAGGTLINGPQQVPTGQWVGQALDPQGVMFGLLSPNP
jgi:predicted enzyme related to lactoylglutathione lyase